MASNVLKTRRGEYGVLDEIGRGGFGTVCKGKDLRTGQSVAIKVRRWKRQVSHMFILARFFLMERAGPD